MRCVHGPFCQIIQICDSVYSYLLAIFHILLQKSSYENIPS